MHTIEGGVVRENCGCMGAPSDVLRQIRTPWGTQAKLSYARAGLELLGRDGRSHT